MDLRPQLVLHRLSQRLAPERLQALSLPEAVRERLFKRLKLDDYLNDKA